MNEPDLGDQLNQAYDYLTTYHPVEMERIKQNLKTIINIDLGELASINPDLAEAIIQDPLQCMKIWEMAAETASTGDMETHGDTPLSPQSPPVSTISTISTIPPYLVNNHDKLVFILSDGKPKNLSEISQQLNLDRKAINHLLYRSDTGSGCVSRGLICYLGDTPPGDTKQVKITEEGLTYIKKIINTKQYNKQENKKNLCKIRFFNLPDSCKVPIGDIRSFHLSKFISVEGVIRQKSEVRPQVVSARFECPGCGNIIIVYQTDTAFKEPSRCSCGRKGRFRMLNKALIDAQRIILEDLGANSVMAELHRMAVLLKSDLCSDQLNLRVGSRVLLSCVPCEIPIEVHGTKTTLYDILLEAIHIKPLEDKVLNISKDDVKEIESFAKKPNLLPRLRRYVAPHIAGNNAIKTALLIQLVSADDSSFNRRGRIHVYVAGAWGLGKTQLGLAAHRIASKSVYCNVTNSSNVGLTASIVKDDFLKGWALEAGAVCLAGNGLAYLDELDKQRAEDVSSLGEPMEKGTVSVSKANIHQSLPAPARILGTGNFKDTYRGGIIDAEALCLKQHVVDRIDILLIAENVDEKLFCNKILSDEKPQTKGELEFIRKYIHYAESIKPNWTLSEDVQNVLTDFFIRVRSDMKDSIIKYSPRLLESLYRITIACAKLHLRNTASVQDANLAVELIKRSLRDRGFYPALAEVEEQDQVKQEVLV